MSQSIVDRIVVPIGGTDREFYAQEQAAQMAHALGAPLYAVHITPDPDNAPDDLFQFVQGLADRHGLEIETRVLRGDDAGLELAEEAGPRDLVVIGTRRLTDRFHVGSVALTVAQQARGAVQIVRLEA